MPTHPADDGYVAASARGAAERGAGLVKPGASYPLSTRSPPISQRVTTAYMAQWSFSVTSTSR